VDFIDRTGDGRGLYLVIAPRNDYELSGRIREQSFWIEGLRRALCERGRHGHEGDGRSHINTMCSLFILFIEK
jgi:hypothetical protein